MVLQPRRYAIRQTVETTAQALGLRLNIVPEHDSARVIRSLYHCGAGFTFTPASSLAYVPPWQLQRGQLVPTLRAKAQAPGSAPAPRPKSRLCPTGPTHLPAPAGWWPKSQPVLHRQYTLAVKAKRAQNASTQAGVRPDAR